jgi:hypothetical protein
MIGSLLAFARLEAVISVHFQLHPFVLDGFHQRMGNPPDLISNFSRNGFVLRPSNPDLIYPK